MIAIRSNFFYTRTVPCELWILNRAKPEVHRDKLRVDRWRDKQATRDAVRQTIQDYLWSKDAGLPVTQCNDEDMQIRADAGHCVPTRQEPARRAHWVFER